MHCDDNQARMATEPLTLVEECAPEFRATTPDFARLLNPDNNLALLPCVDLKTYKATNIETTTFFHVSELRGMANLLEIRIVCIRGDHRVHLQLVGWFLASSVAICVCTYAGGQLLSS